MIKKYEFTEETKAICGRKLHRIRAIRNFGNVKADDLGGFIEKEENLSHEGNCWVRDDVTVYDNARIFGRAVIRGNAEICGRAVIRNNAIICGNALIRGNAEICGDAVICGNAEIYGSAEIYGNAIIYGNAVICGNAVIRGNAEIYGDAVICGNAVIRGNAEIYGNARIFGRAVIRGNAEIFGDAVICGNAVIRGGKWDKSPLYIQGTKWAFYVSSENTVTTGCQTHTYEEWQKNYKQIAEEHGGLEVLTEYIRYFNLACEMYGKEEYKIDLKEKAA